MAALPPPPWHDPTWQAWRVYADEVYDRGAEKGRGRREWLRALRFAVALQHRPRLILKSSSGSGAHHQWELVLRGSRLPRLPNLTWVTPRWAAAALRGYWGVLAGAERPPGGYSDASVLARWGATPDDFPDCPHRLRQRFHWRAAYDVRVREKGGTVWARRGKGPEWAIA